MTFADRARAEAWIAYRNDVQPNPRHEAREHVAFLAGWDAHADALADPTDEEVEPVAREILWMHVTANPDRATRGQWDQARRLARAAIAAFLAVRRGSE